MSIEALMSAAHAAGYVMVAEEELPETFGTRPAVFEFKAQSSTSLAIWRPVVPALDGQPLGSAQMMGAWGWLTGRFVGGAHA